MDKMLKFTFLKFLCDGQGLSGELSCTQTGLVASILSGGQLLKEFDLGRGNFL